MDLRDPDYEITKAAKEQIRVREEIDKNQCIERVKSIIKREFQRELECREKQLELIQSRITKTSKTLHLLRYCLVTSYYNRNDLQFNASENDISSLDTQSGIHPAVKELLGSNASEICTTLGLRKKRTLPKSSSNIVTQESKERTLKKDIVEETETSTDSQAENVQFENAPQHNSVRNRKLYKHQIVVGNISKWAPSESSDDNSTHKWMMYVRGPKEFPDISHIIQKVIFFLHPSYKPNDVIEMSEGPFHLSRRGWGEFPLRVQLYFHGKINKPVDIIHNLKLDKTYTGRQTLGNETVIELSLYDLTKSNVPNCPKMNIPATHVLQQTDSTDEQHISEIDSVDEQIRYQEPMDIKVDVEPTIVTYVNLDHSYCQTDLTNTKTTRNTPEVQNIDANDKLQGLKKRKPQQSLLKNSVLKHIKVDTMDV